MTLNFYNIYNIYNIMKTNNFFTSVTFIPISLF